MNSLGVNCFLIDDDTDDQEIFCMALQHVDKSISCVFANDGLKALEKINSEPSFLPDHIFIDMNMPKMTGLECLKEIRAIDRLKNIPVYMYSTSLDPKSIAEAKKEGCTDFIIKPSTLTALTATLSSVLSANLTLMKI